MSGQDLYRIVYLSHAAQALSVPALDVLLAAARQYNAANGVTGFLACHERSFFQVVEGARSEVERLFAAINRDPRHGGIIVLRQGAVEERSFGEWTMGFADPTQLGPENMAAVTDLHQLMAEGGGAGLRDRRVGVLLDSFLASFRDLAHSEWRVPAPEIAAEEAVSVPDQPAGHVA
ncbi:BLUF domain-containing protein [Primorskyibacter sp. 2E107]|uniref:BLUF domain-containing protein n=1 Tax=Primorskyibacter sp. 2E107 TaxID=3403458 RepID=UPI003AF57C26